MRAPLTVGSLALLAAVCAAGSAAADPILSDRVIITDAKGTEIVNATREENAKHPPELGIASGPLKVPHNALNVDAAFVLTDKDKPDLNSDWMRLRVFSGRVTDTLYFTFKSNPDEKSLKLPGDFLKDAPRLAETGQLQDVTALLFPKWAAAGKAPPFTVEVMSDLDKKADHAPEPAGLTLLGLGAAALGGYAWRRRRAAAA
jgi:hypothetical protein